ncbi:MAG: hypothetical protein NT091_04710 [Candidatus Falkowbacteria bacterium]|nr:hypothetical protein [Candidatus Falkowbacteria bacterium]
MDRLPSQQKPGDDSAQFEQVGGVIPLLDEQIASWETYRDSKYGFEIKHPASCNMKKDTQ